MREHLPPSHPCTLNPLVAAPSTSNSLFHMRSTEVAVFLYTFTTFLPRAASFAPISRGRTCYDSRDRDHTLTLFSIKPNRKQKQSSSSSPSLTKGFGSSPPSTSRALDPEKQIRARLQDYNSTNSALFEAMMLKQKLASWTQNYANMDAFKLAMTLPADYISEMRSAEQKLLSLQQEQGITDRSISNAFHEATWDVMAASRAARHASEKIPDEALAHMRRVVQMGIGDKKPSTVSVLDVGCGTGILSRFLAEAGVKLNLVTGVDLSEGMINVAKMQYPSCKWLKGDFFELPLEPQSFDAVFFNECFHNFADQRAALVRAVQLLRPSGRVVLSHPKGQISVRKQFSVNPILVPSCMPTVSQLEHMCKSEPLLNCLSFVPSDNVDTDLEKRYLVTLCVAS